MKKLDGILLVNSETQENFLHYRMLKNLNLAKEIFIERNGSTALNFIEKYKFANNENAPDIIIFELRNQGDLLFLNHILQQNQLKTYLMIFSLQENLLSDFPETVFYKSGYIESKDVLNVLQVEETQVA